MAEEPLYNSRILNTYIEFTKKNYPQVDIQALLEYAQVEPYQISDEGHWFTQGQHDRFHEKLVELTGNKDIAREAGRYAASSKGVGFFKQYALALMGPVDLFHVGPYHLQIHQVLYLRVQKSLFQYHRNNGNPPGRGSGKTLPVRKPMGYVPGYLRFF